MESTSFYPSGHAFAPGVDHVLGINSTRAGVRPTRTSHWRTLSDRESHSEMQSPRNMIAIAVQTSFANDIQHIRGTSPAAHLHQDSPAGLSARHPRQHGLVVIIQCNTALEKITSNWSKNSGVMASPWTKESVRVLLRVNPRSVIFHG